MATAPVSRRSRRTHRTRKGADSRRLGQRNEQPLALAKAPIVSYATNPCRCQTAVVNYAVDEGGDPVCAHCGRQFKPQSIWPSRSLFAAANATDPR